MGRAQGSQRASAPDAFGALLGHRRGVGDGLQDAHQALAQRDYEPALRAIDEGRAERDARLSNRLAAWLARELAPGAMEAVTDGLQRAGLRRRSEYSAAGLLDVFDAEAFTVQATAAIHDALCRGAGQRRGAQKLRSDCEEALLQSAYHEAAEHLRRGGAEHLRRHFGGGYSQLRGRLASEHDISPQSGALRALILGGVCAQWVKVVCEDPEDYDGHYAKLRDCAVDASLGGR